MTRERIIDILNEYKVRKFAIPRIADRILALEEAKEKPTAPASLMEELEKFCNDVFDPADDNSYGQYYQEGYNSAVSSVREILSKFGDESPTPKYLIEHEKQIKSALKYCEQMAEQNDKLKEILSRHEAEQGEGLPDWVRPTVSEYERNGGKLLCEVFHCPQGFGVKQCQKDSCPYLPIKIGPVPIPAKADEQGEGLTEYDKGEMALDQHLDPTLTKPTAPASMVMKIKIMANKYGRARDMFIDDCHNILSCYSTASHAIAGPTPTYLVEHRKQWEQAVKEQQALYRKNQSLQCEIDRLQGELDKYKEDK